RTSDGDWGANVVADGRTAGGQRARRRPGRLDRAHAPPGISCRHGDNHVGLVEVVDGYRQQILEAVRSATQTHVSDVESVAVRGVECGEDVLRTGALDRGGKDIRVNDQRARSHARHIVR